MRGASIRRILYTLRKQTTPACAGAGCANKDSALIGSAFLIRRAHYKYNLTLPRIFASMAKTSFRIGINRHERRS